MKMNSTFAFIFVIFVLLTEASQSKTKESSKSHGETKTKVTKKSDAEADKLSEEQKLLEKMLGKMPFVPMIPVAFLLGAERSNKILDKSMFTGALTSAKKPAESHPIAPKSSKKKSEPAKTSKAKPKLKKVGKKYSVQKARDDIPDDLSVKSDHDQDVEKDDKGDDGAIDDDDDSDEMDKTDEETDQPNDPATTDEPPIKTINDQVNKVKSETPYTTSGSLSNSCKNPCPMYCAPMCNSYCCANAIYRAYFGVPAMAPSQTAASQLPAPSAKQPAFQAEISAQPATARANTPSSYTPYQQIVPPPSSYSPPYLSHPYSSVYAPPPSAPQNSAATVKAFIAPATPLSALPALTPVNQPSYLQQSRRRLPDTAHPVSNGYPALVQMYARSQQKQKPVYCPASCAQLCSQFCLPQCCGLMKRNQIVGKGKLMHLRDLLLRLRNTLSKKRNVLQNITSEDTRGTARSALLKLKDETSKAKDALTKQTQLREVIPKVIASLEASSPIKQALEGDSI